MPEAEVLRVMGIDPGTRVTGYGVVELKGRRLVPIAWKALRAPSRRGLAERLRVMGEGLREAIATFRPSIIALEDVFAARHARAALGLGQARGMALLVAAEAGLEVVSYPARTIKQTVVGYGGADKEQVQTMVAQILGLKDAPRPQDAADALAVAICHCHTSTMRRRLKASLGDDCSS